MKAFFIVNDDTGELYTTKIYSAVRNAKGAATQFAYGFVRDEDNNYVYKRIRNLSVKYIEGELKDIE